MTVSSTKNRCRNLALLALGFAGIASASEPRLVDLDFKLQFESRFAVHTFNPRDMSSERETVDLSQSAKFGHDWEFVAGGRAYVEGAYASNDRYRSQPVAKEESDDIMLRDLYLQFKRPKILLRLGSQQVVWGEAFGFYYADIVNPKDNRMFGIGDLSEQRIPVPMLNSVFFLDKVTLQVIAIPEPFFNKNPAVGNDFALPYGAFAPGANIVVNDPRTANLTTANTELGARVSTVVHGIDFALFMFSYLNRAPEYSLAVTPPSAPGGAPTATFTAHHSRVATAGFTGTYDWGPFVSRWETLYTHQQPVDAIGYDATNPLAYGTFKSDLYTGVVGLDYTQIPSWRLGMQLSHKHYADAIAGALSARDQTLATLNVDAPVFHDQTFDVLLSYIPQDGSSLLQMAYLIPASQRFEVSFGANILLGGADSTFGRFRGASHAYVQLKGYFGGT